MGYIARLEGRRGVKLWYSPEEWAVLEAAAVSCGVEVGALAREASLWSVAAVAREVSAGRVRLRARSGGGSRPVRPAASSLGRARPRVEATVSAGAALLPAVALDPGEARALAFRRALAR